MNPPIPRVRFRDPRFSSMAELHVEHRKGPRADRKSAESASRPEDFVLVDVRSSERWAEPGCQKSRLSLF